MGLKILDSSDLDTVRAICMSMVTPDRARQLMPNSTLQSFSFAGRAEMLVMRRVGADWKLIAQGKASPIYAGGDPELAELLLRDAALMFTCSLACVPLRQLIPKQEESELIRTTRDLNWERIGREYQDQAIVSLNLLKPQVFASAMIMSHPYPAPSDPDKPTNYQQLRPIYARIIAQNTTG